MSALTLALLGCGKAAAMHAKRLRQRGVSLVFASRESAVAEVYARRFGGRAVASYAAAIAARDVDAVFVTTPPHLHEELALAALAAGKHAIVEKPPFPTLAAFDRVAAAAAACDRQLLVAENYYYKPLRSLLATWLTEGLIGEVVCLVLNALKRQTSGGWRDDPTMAGGGALLEGGIHWVSLLSGLGLTPRCATVHLSGATDPARERASVTVIDYAEGAVATLLYAWNVPSLLQGIRWSRIYGTAGAIGFESNGVVAMCWGRRKRLVFPGLADIAGYGAMLDDFLAAIRANRPPAYDVARARGDLALILDGLATASGTIP